MTNQNNYHVHKVILKFIPIVILVPFLLALIQLWCVKQELFSPMAGIVLVALLTALLFGSFFFILSYYLKKIEKKSQLKEKISRLLIENRKDYALLSLDKSGMMTRWNNSIQRLLGYDSLEIIGKSFSAIFSVEEQNKQIPDDLLQKAKSEKQLEYEGWLVTKNKGNFWALITISALYNKANNLLGFTMLIRNATHLKRRDEKLQQLILRLEESNKELERFAYVASHDLQEPLRMIASFTQLLKKKYGDKLDVEAQEYIDFAVDGAMRMQQLIVDLLAYSRLAKEAKQFAPTNMNSVVEKALRNLRVSLEEAQAEMIIETLPTLMGDEFQLIQLFQNIISNAIKFRKLNAKCLITMSAKLENNQWNFRVQDNGIGIAPQYFEQIFQIFHRLHVREEYPGTGVGLAICKKIIERHNGKIWIESELGKGTTVCFNLPA